MLNRVFQNPLWVKAICALAIIIIVKDCLYIFSPDTRSHRRFGKDQLISGLRTVSDKTLDLLQNCPCRAEEAPFSSTGSDGVITFNLNKNYRSTEKRIGLLATERYNAAWYDAIQELPGKLKQRNEKIYAAAISSQIKYAKRHGYRFTKMKNAVAKERSEQFSAGRLQQTLNPVLAQEARRYNELLHRFDTLLVTLLEELQRSKKEQVEWLFMISENLYFANKEIPLHEYLPPSEMAQINFLVAESGGPTAGISGDVLGVRVHADSASAFAGLISYTRWREQQGEAFSGPGMFAYIIHNKRHRRFRHMIATVPSRWFHAEVTDSDEANRFQEGDLAVHFTTATIRHMNDTIQSALNEPEKYSKKLEDSTIVKPSHFWAARQKAKTDAKEKVYDLRNRYIDIAQKADSLHADARWIAHVKAMDAIVNNEFAFLPTDVEVAGELLSQMDMMIEIVAKEKTNKETPEAKELAPGGDDSALDQPNADELKDGNKQQGDAEKHEEENKDGKADKHEDDKKDSDEGKKEEEKKDEEQTEENGIASTAGSTPTLSAAEQESKETNASEE